MDEEKKPEAELTHRQKLWIEHYLITKNATEAARLAGYKQPRAIGHQNLTKLAKHITPVLDKALEDLGFDKRDTIKEMVSIATSDLNDISEFTGDSFKVKAFEDMPAAARRCIKSIKYKTYSDKSGEITNSVEVALWDKVKALDMLGRHFGVFAEDNKQLGDAVGRLIGLPLDMDKVTGGEA